MFQVAPAYASTSTCLLSARHNLVSLLASPLHHYFPSKQLGRQRFLSSPCCLVDSLSLCSLAFHSPSPLPTFHLKLIRTYSKIANCQQECRLLNGYGLLVSPTTLSSSNIGQIRQGGPSLKVPLIEPSRNLADRLSTRITYSNVGTSSSLFMKATLEQDYERCHSSRPTLEPICRLPILPTTLLSTSLKV
jgi:hypothetical protein